MTESTVTLIIGITTQLTTVVLGYWAYRAKTTAKTAATVAVSTAETVKQRIEETHATVAATAVAVGQVQKQTNGYLATMEKTLKEKTAALNEEMEKVRRLTAALDEARGGEARRITDP
jgi:hypothetical protein